MSGHCILTLINRIHASIKPVLNSLIIVLLGTGFVVAAEIDDSSMFVDAFNAYQNDDYLLATNKLSTLNQLFPDTPLRDVALLLLARSGLKSGDNELAAHSIGNFTREFAGHPFTPDTVEKLKKHNILPQPGEERHSTARAADHNQLAGEQSDSRRNLMQQDTAEQARPTGPAVGKRASGADQRKQRAARNITPLDITAAITVSIKDLVVEAGQTGFIPFQISNPAPVDEEFILAVSAPAEYRPQVTINNIAAPQPTIVAIGKGGRLRGTVSFYMPLHLLDGHKATVSLQASSNLSGQVVRTRDIPIITAAPLVRVVARPLTPRPIRGEQMQYRVTLLNVGTVPDRRLTARVHLPEQIEFLDAPGVAFQQESVNTIAFRVDTLEIGKLIEFTMKVKIRENSVIGQELRSRIEIFHEQTKLTEMFSSLATVVRGN